MGNFRLSDYIQSHYSNVFFTCEGENEEETLRWIIEENRLCFPVDICDFNYLRKGRSRNGKKELINNCMEYGYKGRVVIIYLLDSCSEKWKLNQTEAKQIDILRILTPPEIEILFTLMNPNIEHAWKKYCKDTNDHAHPSSFCKQYFKDQLHKVHINNVKSAGALRAILGSIDELDRVAQIYKGHGSLKSERNAWYLADLFK